ncbi:amino acid adenylation domain-containing protein [Streptosporangium sandarakinum]|uniref:amino acid adenylation domain-containing protein n=1 Tax=Streptosporangium sandarakinum TaxID=1260955 RepID=UPI00378DD85C
MSDSTFPVTFGQQGLWFIEEFDGGTDAYNDGEAFRLAGPLDVPALVAAVDSLVTRHEALRTRFTVVDGTPRQVVDERWAGRVEVVESVEVADRGKAALSFAQDVLARRFDLVSGPLFRIEVLSFDPSDHVLVMAMHHIIGDGGSISVLLEELAACYEAAMLGEPVRLAALPVRYTDYAKWQREAQQSGELARQLAYWLDQVAEVPHVVPVLGTRRPGGRPVGGVVGFRLDETVTIALQELSRSSGTTLFMTLLAVYEALLSRVTDAPDLLVGAPALGRTLPEVEGVVGLFANTLALRADLRDDPRFRDLLARVRKVALGGYANQDLPFDRLVEAVNPARVIGVPPLVQAIFQLFNHPFAPELNMRGVRAAPLHVLGRALPFPLALDCFREGGGLHGRLYYDQAVFDEDFASGFASAFRSLVDQVLANVDLRVSQLSVPEKLCRSGEAVTAEGLPSGASSRPRPGVEEVVADVMADVLGLDRIGRDDDFFALGGHSLPAVKMVSRVKKLFKTAVSVRALFENPTVAEFAALLMSEARPTTVPAVRVADDEIVPMSFSQQQLWFVQELDPANTAYHLGEAFRLSGRLSVDALTEAVDRLVARQEALRTRFTVRDGVPAQVIEDRWQGCVGVTDAGPVADRDEAARLFAQEVMGRGFDLVRGPLFRAEVLRFDDVDHVLVLAMHHIVADGWSLELLLEELAGLYRGDRLPWPSLRYRDFAVWQREVFRGEIRERQLAYWLDHVEGAPLVLDALRPKGRTADGGREGAVEFELPAGIAMRLRRLSRESGGTLFMTLLAVFEVLVSRVTGERDLLIGVPSSWRAAPELERVAGFFVNMLALRADLRANPTFTDLLTKVREVVLSGFTHQDLPFEDLVEALNPERALDVPPVVQVAFQVFEAEVAAGFELGDVKATPVPGIRHGLDADLPLAMDLYRDGDGLRGLLTYNRSVLSAEEAEQLATAFRTLIHEVLSDPDRPVGELPLLPGAATAVVLDLSSGRGTVGTESSLVDEFERIVAASPDAVALVDEDGSWTFAELERAVGTVSRAVAGSGDFIAVAGGRSKDIIAALLGVMRSGAAVVPLDLSHPLDWIRGMVESTGAEMLLCDETGARALNALELKRVPLDQKTIAPGEGERRPVRPSDLAVVMFTSGSTGTPKGVLLEHGAMTNLLHAHKRAHFGGSGPRRVALSASIAFDAAWDQLLWLIAGHELHIVDEETRRDTERLLRFVREHRIDVLDVPQAQLVQLLDLGLLRGEHRPSTLIMGGEAVRPPLWRRLAAEPAVEVWNFYGPTECTIDALTWRLHDSAGPLIGKPVDNTSVRILDDAGNLLPIGIAGEIFLAGKHVARGYLNLPSLTADRFVPDPFSTEPGARMYRTGDLGRLTQTGAVEFLGRSDEQVKIRGHRVEPAEIESVLTTHPDVEEAVVSIRRSVAGEDELVAHVLLKEHSRPPLAELCSFTASRLPEYMLPRLIPVDSMPRLVSGKVDTRALPLADIVEPDAFVPPRTSAEQVIAAIMAGVLGLPRVGRFDDFFRIGGHSLNAGKVVSRIRKLFGVAVSIRSLFENPTVARFAAAVSDAVSLTPQPIQRTSGDGAYPMSPAQQRLWLVHQLDPESTAYNMGELFRLRGPLDLAALTAAVEELVDRHEILRSRFAVADSAPVQIVDERWQGQVEVRPAAGPVTRAIADFTEYAMSQVYDLATGPLYRVGVLRLSEHDHVLALMMHHIVSDGWSVEVMLNEISDIYRDRLAGSRSRREPLPVQYGDFAVWQLEQLDDEALDRQLAYWVEHVSDASFTLDTLSPHGRTTEQGATTVEFSLSAETTAGLRELSSDVGGTLFMTLLSVFECLISRMSGNRNFLVGVPVAGRTVPEVEGLIGFFVNLLALRADLRDDPSFEDLVARVRDVVLGGFANQDLPFERLVKAVNPERTMDRSPLVQVTFQLFEEPADSTFALPGLEVTALDTSTEDARFDLSLDMFLDGDGMRGWFSCARSVLPAEEADRLAGWFVKLVETVLDDPLRPVSELPSIALKVG